MPLFQNESKCETFHMKNEFCMRFHFHANQSHFHKNGFAVRLALKQRHKGTRKWPIAMSHAKCVTKDYRKIQHAAHFWCGLAVFFIVSFYRKVFVCLQFPYRGNENDILDFFSSCPLSLVLHVTLTNLQKFS